MSLLPHCHRPGTDLISKAILSDHSVVRLIENGLGLEKNEYEPAQNEWKTGQRSDVILEAKSLDFPPVILEIENQINDTSMRKTLDYARVAEKKTGLLPVILIFNTNTIDKTVVVNSKNCNVEGCLEYSCKPWADTCLIFSKTLVKNLDMDNLDPLTAIGLFLGEGERSLALSKYRNDSTMKKLYDLAWEKLELVNPKRLSIKDKVASLLEEIFLFCEKVKHKVHKHEPVNDTIKYIDGFKIELGKRERADSNEDDDEEEEEPMITKKRRWVPYSDEEKKFVVSYMEQHPNNTYEDCKAAGAKKGLFRNREVRFLSNLHQRLKKNDKEKK